MMRRKFSSFLRIVIALVALVSVIAYGLLESGHPYMNPSSLFLTLLFGSVLYAFSGKFSDRYPPVMMVTLVLILFVQLRLLGLIVLPESLLHNSQVTSDILNSTLVFIIFGTIACYLGFSLGYGRNGPPGARSAERPVFRDEATLKILSIAYFISLVLQLFVLFTSGYAGSSGEGEHLGLFRRYLFRLVDSGLLLTMFVVAYILLPHRASNFRLLVVLVLFNFILTIMQGSRGGIFYILVTLVATKIVIDGNFRFKFAFRHLLVVFLLPPLVFVAFMGANIYRGLWYGTTAEVYAGFASLPQSGEIVSLVIAGASEMSRRMSYMEPVIFVMSFRELGFFDVSELVNVKTTLLSSINRLIPGKPLGDILFTEFAFAYIISPEGIHVYADSGRLDYVGYEWSMYGISYQLFGFLGGGVFIFGFTALLARIMRAFRDWGSLNGFAFGSFFIYVLISWVGNLGLDNLIDRAVHMFILLCIYIAGYTLVRELLKPHRQAVRGVDA